MIEVIYYLLLACLICPLIFTAQRDYSTVEKENKEETKAISDSYTLLYEDNEGDRMLVGDVPWK